MPSLFLKTTPLEYGMSAACGRSLPLPRVPAAGGTAAGRTGFACRKCRAERYPAGRRFDLGPAARLAAASVPCLIAPAAEDTAADLFMICLTPEPFPGGWDPAARERSYKEISMQTIGITGLSGAGKDTAAMMLAHILSGLGDRVGVDRFGAPIKWVCRSWGWDGEVSVHWRGEMQRLAADARARPDWAADHPAAFERDARYRRLDMVRLEQLAAEWGHDKFVFWLGVRNGFCIDNSFGGWYRPCVPGAVGQPDFLIIPDVRYPAEAAFCRDTGVLLGLAGTHMPLQDILASHVSESHIPALLEECDHVVPFQACREDLAGVLLRLIAGGGHVRETYRETAQRQEPCPDHN